MTAHRTFQLKTMNRFILGSFFAALMFAGFGVGTAAAQAGDDQEYRRAFNAGLEAHQARDHNEAYRQFARAAQLAAQAGDEEVARRAARVAAQLDYNIGNALARNERFEDAAKRYEAGIKLDPGYPHNYVALATALRGLNRVDEAMDMFMKGHEIARAANDREMAQRAHQGVRDHFVAIASQALGRNENAPRRSDADVAISALTALQEYIEADADVYFFLAVAHNARTEYDKAVEMADAGLAIHRGSRTDAAKIHFVRGEALMNLGQNDAARAAFQAAAVGEYRAPAEHYLSRL
jgi:tetratricopeptide (TPR) repeat protein